MTSLFANFKFAIFTLLIFVVFTKSSFAIESRSQREAVVSSRSKRFFKANRAKQYLSLTGNYSDTNTSRSYQINSRYLYQTSRFINELNFDYELKFADVGSGKKKRYDIKTVNNYDFGLTSKAKLFATNFYSVFYHRTIFDKLSAFYSDNRTAVGIGYILFKEQLEIDFSASNHVIKTSGHKIDYIISHRLNYKISNNFYLNQRGFLYFDNNSLDGEIRSSFIYRINNKFYLELSHNFEQRRYREIPNKPVIDNISRSLSFGIVFDLGGE